MKSELIESSEKIEPKPEYPCLKYYVGGSDQSTYHREFNDTPFVVLFDEECCGTVVYVKPKFMEWSVGNYHDNWHMSSFKPIPDNGKVVLSGDLI